MAWIRDNIEVLVLLSVLALLAMFSGCVGRPNVTSYMKQQESSLAVQRCLERFIHLTGSKAISVDFELGLVDRSTEKNTGGAPLSTENLIAGRDLCMALYFDD